MSINDRASGGVVLGLVLAGAALASWPAAAAGQEVEDEECLSCHKEGKRRVHPDVLKASAHRELACAECHRNCPEAFKGKKLRMVPCATCHEDAAKQVKGGIHAELAAKGVADLPGCAGCHGSHDVYPKGDPRSRVNHLKVDRTCLACHQNPEITKNHSRMPSPEAVGKYEGSVHGRAVHLKGLTVAATCTDCHGHHDMRPKNDPASTVHPSKVPGTCSTCHLGVYEDWKTSAHGRAWDGGKGKGPQCTTCHESHGVAEPMGAAFRLRAPQNCGGCHEAKAGTYGDAFHGKATSLGFAVAATCSDCHTPHRNLAKADPASSVHPSNLKGTCGRCHPGASASFVRYDPHSNPKDRSRSGLVYWVHAAMIGLLSGTMGFFAIHTLLWLQRSIVALVRGRREKEPRGWQYVRRFSPLAVRLHVVVVISFLVLVLTGLPLRFHHAGWSKVIVSVMGGIEVTRFFHRLCAVLTFGYAGVHVAWLAWQVVARRRKGLLFGPDSLFPRWKDLTDMLQNLRWFLYLGPPPRFGRWTYFEKFDYFAVFWGVPVIGLSGLMLWFPRLFTAFLPGEALNVATVVHSEEALLAASFIFAVHFFHNHLRPENFPMDTSIFTGVVPLERFQRERPEEYEALVKAGRLEEWIVPPPPARVLVKARVFGFAALALGIALVVAIAAGFILS